MLVRRTALILILSLFAFSCSDDSNPSNPDDGEAPDLPSLTAIQPDLSFFLNNSPQKANQTVTNFNAAKSFALSFSTIMSFGQVYTEFFQAASQSEAELENGAWVWDYDYGYQGESASVVLTSRESGNSVLWDMTISYSGPQGSYDDYKMVEGQTSKDGNSGSWTFNSLSTDGSEEVPAMASNWEKTSDTEVMIETSYYSSEGALQGTFTYTRDASDFMINATGDSENDVHWNTDTQEGYYETEGERMCWDSDLQDTPC